MCNNITIDGVKIGEGCPSYIIAEMSANHLQDISRAKTIIEIAKEVGANAIKLQSYRPDTITIDCDGEEFMATKGSIWEGKNLYQLYQQAYMPWEWHEELFEYARTVGITIFSSPFDMTAVELLEGLQAPAYKVASYEIYDTSLIERIANTGKPIIFSTGIATLTDIERAVEVCKACGNESYAILKCVSEYPTPYEELNLRTIPNIKETFGCVCGLSDHSMGNAVDVAAVTLGANIIEKHLTLKRADGGPDSIFSMEPEEFKSMVSDIRKTEKALGRCTYELTEFQKKALKNARSLYVVKDIKKGEIFSELNVRSIRPGKGIRPWHMHEIIGKRAAKDISYGTALRWEHIGK